MKRSSTARTLLLLGSLCGSASCESLFGGLSTGNPDSCVATPTLCQAPEQVCNTETRECEPALRIDTISPSAAPYGMAVPISITGKNFVPNMTLSIGDRPTTMLNFLADSLFTAVAPESNGPKTPLTLDLLSPSSQRLRLEGRFHYFPWPTFDPPVQLSSPSGAKFIRSGDFNQDGRPDLALAGDSVTHVAIYFGQANGTLLPGPPITFSGRPFGIALGDINGDGKIDMVVSETAAQPVLEIALGNGDGTFSVKGTVNTANTVGAMALVDLNSDRLSDLVIGDGKNIATYRSQGDGTFAAPVQIPHSLQSLDSSASTAMGDLNRDGRPDLIFANNRDTRVLIYFNQGDGTLSAAKSLTYSSILSTPAVGDLNRDGNLDLVFSVRASSQLQSFIGDGTGGFTAGSAIPSFPSTESIGVADMNGV